MNNEQYDKFVKLAEEQKRIGKDLVQVAEELDEYMSYTELLGLANLSQGCFILNVKKITSML